MNGDRQPGNPAKRRLSGMSSWHPDCYQRAAAYVTGPRGRLLVFDHVDVDAGTQVPAGGIHEDETAEHAVLRELEEESGLDSAVIVRKLGESWNRSEPGNMPAGLEEHIVHVFHLQLDHPPSHEEWQWEERSGTDVVEHRFAFHWVSLADAATMLWPHQAAWVHAVSVSLQHPL